MRGWRATVLLGASLGALLVLGAAGLFLSAPLFWERYLAAHARSAARAPAWYQPRERIAGAPEPMAPRVSPELESLDARALSEAAAYAAAQGSLALIVTRHDHIVFERYWQGSGFDTLTDAQSFTRLLAALAAGVAVSHRRIGWPDEPIGYIVRELRDRRGAITVRNLMQLSSGLTPPSASRAPWSAAARALFGTDVTGAALARPLSRVPGEAWAPQPADPQLLSLVIERATGERYASYLSEVLWRRVGASDAWLYLDRPAGAAHADCCLLAQQGDWIRIAELLLGDGNYRGYEIIRPGWVKALRVPALANHDYGAYLRLSGQAGGGKEPYVAPDTFAVDNEGGNRLWLIPSLEIAVLCTAVLPRGADFDDARIPNLIAGAARDFVPPAARPGDLSRIVPGH
ncbi:MAG TPA: serine hydrolase [Steroidobacteraceae bacterium]|nr:serine hydrolase [Steroidobacteraceae bacterium]